MKKIILFFLIIILINNIYAAKKIDIKKCYIDAYKYEKTKNYKDAIRTILPVLDLYPTDYYLNLKLGWLSYLNKSYADAEKYYLNSANYNKNSIESKLGLTLVYLATQKYTMVEKLCHSIIQKDYYNYYANLRLIYSLNSQNKLKAAKKIIDKMIYLYPSNVIFLTELGKNLYSQKNYNAAYEIFTEILTFDPENITAKKYLYG